MSLLRSSNGFVDIFYKYYTPKGVQGEQNPWIPRSGRRLGFIKNEDGQVRKMIYHYKILEKLGESGAFNNQKI